jgi:hypothetical protein
MTYDQNEDHYDRNARCKQRQFAPNGIEVIIWIEKLNFSPAPLKTVPNSFPRREKVASEFLYEFRKVGVENNPETLKTLKNFRPNELSSLGNRKAESPKSGQTSENNGEKTDDA